MAYETGGVEIARPEPKKPTNKAERQKLSRLRQQPRWLRYPTEPRRPPKDLRYRTFALDYKYLCYQWGKGMFSVDTHSIATLLGIELTLGMS